MSTGRSAMRRSFNLVMTVPGVLWMTAHSAAQQTTLVSVNSGGEQGGRYSDRPAFTADGRIVAFESGSWNLVQGDTNRREDIFVHDRGAGLTWRVSVDSTGVEGNDSSTRPAISADGAVVAFQSEASNLVLGDTRGHSDVFIHDSSTGITERVSVGSGGEEGNGDSYQPALSADGRVVAFMSLASNLVPGDDADADVFVHDRLTRLTERVSVTS